MGLSQEVVIVCLVIFLISLVGFDVWDQYSRRYLEHWWNVYTDGVASEGDSGFWDVGFRVENLELKLDSQATRLKHVDHVLNELMPRMKLDAKQLRSNQHDFKHTRAARVAMHGLLTNDSSIYRLRCGERGSLLRIGLNDYRTDSRDSCLLFTDTVPAPEQSNQYNGHESNFYSHKRIMPQSFFEKVELGEGAFGLRPMIANGLYLQMVPPNNQDEWNSYPWKVAVGGPVAGHLERFRQDDSGYLYSAALEGYLQCSGGTNVKGTTTKYTSSANKFVLEKVEDGDVKYAQEVVSLSDQILEIQSGHVETNQRSKQAMKAAADAVTSSTNDVPVRICIGIPMTSKGTQMDSVKDSPLWSNLFDSFMKSIDWRSNRYIFRFYLGFDKADELYDTGDAWSLMREEFKSRARYRMSTQFISEKDIEAILDTQLTLKIMHFDHLQGAPTQVVSQLMLSAYVDNFDYFYQVNDDTIIETANWPPLLIKALAENPMIPNFGVTGPLDTNNDKIFTHSFVHRTHIEVFGYYFPPSFKNWWSDDWISTVYGSEHTFRPLHVEIKHNVESQKKNGYTRYEVDHEAQFRLDAELRRGFVKVDAWLRKNDHPRLPLPAICGYIPMARYLYSGLGGDAHRRKVVSKRGKGKKKTTFH